MAKNFKTKPNTQLLSEFYVWEKNTRKRKDKYISNDRTYLNNLVRKQINKKNTNKRIVSDEMCKFYSDSTKDCNYPIKGNYLENIDSLLKAGDTLYALSYCDIMIAFVERCIKKCLIPQLPQLKNDFNYSYRALKNLREYLKTKNISCSTGVNTNIDKIRNKINKPQIHKIDGIEGLISEIGIKKVIQWAIKQSYFFESQVVIDRHQELCNLFKSNINIPARKSTKDNINANYSHQPTNGKWDYVQGTPSLRIPIVRDKDGNAFVRQLIKKETGYTVCEGRDSIFQNYVISHIWGRAFDPRYFTSLWNIVLIPAWANGLMDKVDPEEGSPASIFQSTFQALCTTLYFNNALNNSWFNGIGLPKCPQIYNPNDIKPGSYDLNIINKKPNSISARSSLVARIKQIKVTIK